MSFDVRKILNYKVLLFSLTVGPFVLLALILRRLGEYLSFMSEKIDSNKILVKISKAYLRWIHD